MAPQGLQQHLPSEHFAACAHFSSLKLWDKQGLNGPEEMCGMYKNKYRGDADDNLFQGCGMITCKYSGQFSRAYFMLKSMQKIRD
eukprot:1161084-Pelagomonas_calceolata.AAC.14